ncbi:hypothetical protein AB0H76_17060 [Nocardia sp. NPDC050712]|uniref:hypothetical protein n=1 Tax=Nocardia sp. NPDC050712 TaxID=3155518 RepID=UPI00340BC3F5
MAKHNKPGMFGKALRALALTGIAAAITKFVQKRQADQRASERQAYSRAATAASH